MCKCVGKTAGKPDNVDNALLWLVFVLLQPVHIVGLWNDSKTRCLKIRSERTCEEWNGEPVSANVTSTSSSNIGRQKLLKQKYLSFLLFLPPTNFSAMPTFWTIYSIVNVGTSCMVSLFNFWKWTIEHEGNQKYFSLVPPSPQPNYICGVTADGISSLPLWDGGDNFPSHLPRSSSARCPPPNMRTVHRNALLDTVAPKDMIHAKTGGRNNLYDWIPSSPDVFPSSYMGGRHCSECLFRKIKLWGRNRSSLWWVWSRPFMQELNCRGIVKQHSGAGPISLQH